MTFGLFTVLAWIVMIVVIVIVAFFEIVKKDKRILILFGFGVLTLLFIAAVWLTTT